MAANTHNRHDHSYKLLFSHPEMVRDLLTGFVKEAWVEQLDFSTLEKVSGSYITEDLREREDDVIWRVRWGDDWLYVYLLLEFQSSEDRYMAVRIMTYLGLLYQDLIRQKAFTPSGKLPPVLPVVLYNGEQQWAAAQNIADLVDLVPGGLERYRPDFSYLILDEGAIVSDPSWSDQMRNVAAALFRLEHNRDEQDMLEVLGRLVEWLKAPEQTGLRRAFVVWMRRVLLPGRAPEMELPEFTDLQDLHEVHSMLAERIKQWPERWEEKGRQEGRQEGRHEGVEDVLRKLISLKFGELPAWADERLKQASDEQLDKWVMQILSVNDLGELLGEH